jgi:hypothetical protein
LRDLAKVDYGNRKACRACAIRARCTNGFRIVSRLGGEGALDRMATRLNARPELQDLRRAIVEHPFGSIKQWMHQGAFLMRGLANVRRIQPDRACLQHAPGAQHPRRQGDDSGGCGLSNAPPANQTRDSPRKAFPGATAGSPSPNPGHRARNSLPPVRHAIRTNPVVFPHGLRDFCTRQYNQLVRCQPPLHFSANHASERGRHRRPRRRRLAD